MCGGGYIFQEGGVLYCCIAHMLTFFQTFSQTSFRCKLSLRLCRMELAVQPEVSGYEATLLGCHIVPWEARNDIGEGT